MSDGQINVPGKMEWDPDITVMQLSDIEKNGLQVYRNYQKAFHKHASEKVVEHLDSLPFDEDEYRAVIFEIVRCHDALVAIVATSYADKLLEQMYKTELPADVPGGKKSLLGAYGPFDSFAKRLRLAYCFGWVDSSAASDIDLVREIRNRFAHDWRLKSLDDPVVKALVDKMSAADDFLFGKPAVAKLGYAERFRVRTLMALGIFTASTFIYPKAHKAGLQPAVLMLQDQPKVFRAISKHSIAAAQQFAVMTAKPSWERQPEPD